MSQTISQPKPQSYRYNELFTYIKDGTIKLPKFQRDFVWELDKSAKLLDSIIKGYPIGTFIIWKTRERLNSIKNIGNANLPDTPEGDFIRYVLDGQQRLASIFVSVEGLIVKKENKDVDYKQIFIDLDKEIDDSDPIITIEKPNSTTITIYDLLNKNTSFLVENYKEFLDKIDTYKDRFKTYDFSAIEISEYPIDKAVDIFTRINTTGKELSLFEIMVAKTYDEVQHFDLAEKYQQLSDELKDVDYEIPDATVLQCVSLNLVNDCTRKTILRLEKQRIIDNWDRIIESIKKAIDYFRIEFQISVSRILPYPAQIVPFSYFFFHKDRPTNDQRKLLEEYFWKSSLTYRFSSGVESKLSQDSRKIHDILDNKKPEYDLKMQLSITKEEIRDYWFSTGDSFCKAILCLFASFGPKSFNNNRQVKLDNSWLVKSNSKNYHHFFPRSYLEKNGYSDTQQNVITNITIVDDFLNKREIGAKSPSEYMKKFEKENSMINDTMKTHLIDDLDAYGIWEDNYEKFLNMRAERIFNELKTRFNP